MNQFVQRIANYVANEVLIKGLANSKTFQRVVLKTDSTLQQVKKEGAERLEMTFEEMMNQQAAAAAAEASGGGAAAKGGARSSGRPVPPRGGVGGFVSAVAKEVKHDFTGGGAAAAGKI